MVSAYLFTISTSSLKHRTSGAQWQLKLLKHDPHQRWFLLFNLFLSETLSDLPHKQKSRLKFLHKTTTTMISTGRLLSITTAQLTDIFAFEIIAKANIWNTGEILSVSSSHWSEWVRRRRCTNKLWRSVRFTATRSEFRDSTEWKIWLNTGLDGDDDDVSVSISKVYVLSCPVHRKHLAAINRHLSFPPGAFKSGEESKRASRYQRVISIDREGEGERELLFVDLYSLNFTSLHDRIYWATFVKLREYLNKSSIFLCLSLSLARGGKAVRYNSRYLFYKIRYSPLVMNYLKISP